MDALKKAMMKSLVKQLGAMMKSEKGQDANMDKLMAIAQDVDPSTLTIESVAHLFPYLTPVGEVTVVSFRSNAGTSHRIIVS